ncbi:MAG: hypothetical protein ABIC91_03000 [Nanoarchaeota archaeon]
MTQRFIGDNVASYNDELIKVGADELYKPMCREHYKYYKENK